MNIDFQAILIVVFILLGFLFLGRVVSSFKEGGNVDTEYQNYFSYFYGAGSVYLLLFHLFLRPLGLLPKYIGQVEYFTLVGVEVVILVLFTLKLRMYLIFHILFSITLCGVLGFYAFENIITRDNYLALSHGAILLVLLAYLAYLKKNFAFRLFPEKKPVEMTLEEQAAENDLES